MGEVSGATRRGKGEQRERDHSDADNLTWALAQELGITSP